VASLNSCSFIGRLGRDPEMRYTPAGQAVTQFSIAVDHNHKNDNGEWETDTTWINVICWRDLAERTAEWLRKGRLIYVEGRLQVRQYVNREGVPGKAVEVIANKAFALDKRPDDMDVESPVLTAPAQSTTLPAATGGGNGTAPEAAYTDLDDLPF
jgi:single-strand DNA-binding protein